MSINTDFTKEISKIIKEYGGQVFDATQKALDDASIVLEKELAAATPVGSSSDHFKDNWDRKRQYKNVRYVGNKKTVRRPAYVSKKTGETTNHAGGIPLTSLFEHARHMRPFIGRTWEINKNKIFETFKKSFERRI